MFYINFVFSFVQITSGEYIQMSGRAGRRGIDDRGIVMLMVDEQMDSTVGKNLLRVRSPLVHINIYNVHVRSHTYIHVHNMYIHTQVMYMSCIFV